MDLKRKIPAVCGLRNPEIEGENTHWENKDLATIDFSKPTLMVFGGNGTITTRNANNVCRVEESLVGLKIDSQDMYSSYPMYNVVGFVYGRDDETATVGSMSDQDIEDIVNQAMFHRVFDENGVRRELDSAKKLMSTIKFGTHCYGAQVVDRIMTSLNKKMKIGGYSNEEINEVFAQTFQLTYSPITDSVQVPTVRVDSLIDSFHFGLGRLYKDRYGKALEGIEVHFDNAGYFRGEKSIYTQQDLITIWSSQLKNTEDNADKRNILDEHAIDVSLELTGEYTSKNGGVNADAVAKMGGYCLAMELVHALNNSKSDTFVSKPPLESYVEAVNDIKSNYVQEDLIPSFAKV